MLLVTGCWLLVSGYLTKVENSFCYRRTIGNWQSAFAKATADKWTTGNWQPESWSLPLQTSSITQNQQPETQL